MFVGRGRERRLSLAFSISSHSNVNGPSPPAMETSAQKIDDNQGNDVVSERLS